jgi:[acyl-carrier-protein] S-malonyltransferase
MRDAAEAFARVLDSARISDATTPIVCNVDGAAVTGAEDLRSRLLDQLVRPVMWTRCIEGLLELGAGVLVEVGPGSVLTGLARRAAPGTPALSVATEQAMRELAGAAAVS